MEKSKKPKAICPACKGNGYTVIPYNLAMKHEIMQCQVCKSEGEIDADKVDDVIIDADGIHKLQ